MEVFVSWSGERSAAVAAALQDWLPMTLQSVHPWLSQDIDKGARWEDVISQNLDLCDYGIVCLTPENLQSAWILFEAGALSKKIHQSRVCTLLYDLKESDVAGPLARFQHTRTEKADMRRLIETLNKGLGADAVDRDRLRKMFELCWPEFEKRLAEIPTVKPSDTPARRPADDKLDELITEVRAMRRTNEWQVHRDVLESIVKNLVGETPDDGAWIPTDYDERIGKALGRWIDKRRRRVMGQLSRKPQFPNFIARLCEVHHVSPLLEPGRDGTTTVLVCCDQFLQIVLALAADQLEYEDAMNRSLSDQDAT
jgi:hypothetical protein